MDREDILNKVFESDDEGTHDHEADMARSQLLRMAEKSIKLLKWRPKYNNLKLILKSAFKWEKKIKKS